MVRCFVNQAPGQDQSPDANRSADGSLGQNPGWSPGSDPSPVSWCMGSGNPDRNLSRPEMDVGPFFFTQLKPTHDANTRSQPNSAITHLNRVPASAGVRAGLSPLSGGR